MKHVRKIYNGKVFEYTYPYFGVAKMRQMVHHLDEVESIILADDIAIMTKLAIIHGELGRMKRLFQQTLHKRTVEEITNQFDNEANHD